MLISRRKNQHGGWLLQSEKFRQPFSVWEMSLMDRYFYVSEDLQKGDYLSQNWDVEILGCAFGIKLQRNSTGEIGQRLVGATP